VKLSDRQRAALVVIKGQQTTNPGSVVLLRALGNRPVGPTLESLVQRGLVQKIRRTDTNEVEAYSYQLTPAGRKLMEGK
jgi:hypothetical protein